MTNPKPGQQAPPQGYPQQTQNYGQQAPPQTPASSPRATRRATATASSPRATRRATATASSPRPQAPELPKTGLADFLNQPAMSGAALQFPIPGTRYRVKVARDLTDADVQVQMLPDNVTPRRFRDGKVMTVLVVPCLITPDAAHPDGRAAWWVKGQAAEP